MAMARISRRPTFIVMLLLAVVAATALLRKFQSTTESISGILRSGILAIGGETSGWIIATSTRDVEVDVAAVAKDAAALDGQSVVANGHWEDIMGVERGRRPVLVIQRLRPR